MNQIRRRISNWRRWISRPVLLVWLLVIIGGLFSVTAAANELQGLVCTTNGEPILNATVMITGVLAGRGAVYVSDAPDCHRRVVTRADGIFSFAGLGAETNFFGVVMMPGYVLQSFSYPNRRGGTLKIELTPGPAGDDPKQMIRGRVVDVDGQPVADARVHAAMIYSERGGQGGGEVYTDQQGEFVFRAGEEMNSGDFDVQANGYAAHVWYGVKPGADTRDYVLSPGASITGRLVKDGRPVPDAGVGIYGVTNGGYLNTFSVVTDRNGRFIFAGLPVQERFYLYGIMSSLRELGALPRQYVKTGDLGTRLDLGDLHLIQGYTIAGRVQMRDGKPSRVAGLWLARTELTPPLDHPPTKREESNRSFYGLEHSFDDWRDDPGADGRFEFTGVPGETVSLCVMLKPFDLVSARTVSSDGRGFRLLGMVVSNKTDLVVELEPHAGQVFPQARDYEALSHQPLEGAEGEIGRQK